MVTEEVMEQTIAEYRGFKTTEDYYQRLNDSSEFRARLEAASCYRRFSPSSGSRSRRRPHFQELRLAHAIRCFPFRRAGSLPSGSVNNSKVKCSDRIPSDERDPAHSCARTPYLHAGCARLLRHKTVIEAHPQISGPHPAP
jgi:hypothetical protein